MMSGSEDLDGLGYLIQEGDWTRALFEAIDDAVFVHDPEGNILEVNSAACRRLGYTRDELLHLNTRDIDDPEFASGFADRLKRQLEKGQFHCEGRHRTREGRLIPVDINSSVIQVQGRPAVLAVMRDISQRKQTEDTLARQSRLLQSILDHMADGVLVVDAQERLLALNPAARKLFGMEPGEGEPGRMFRPVGIFLADKITPWPLSDWPLSRAVRGQEVPEVEIFFHAEEKLSGRWLSATARPLRDDKGLITGGLMVARDISEHKRAESRQTAQYAVARVLAGGTTVDESARAILQVLGECLGSPVASLWIVKKKEKVLQCLESWHHPRVEVPEFLAMTRRMALAPGLGLPGRVWLQNQPVFIHNIQEEPNFPRTPAALREGLKSALAFPINSGGEIAGVIEFFFSTQELPDPDLVSMMTSLGSQIGLVLQRQSMERALRDSEALYHSLVECLPQNVFRKDSQGRFTFANRNFLATVKKPIEELLGKTDFDFYPKELAAKYVRDDMKVMETGGILETVEEHVPPNGSKLYVQVVKTPVRDARGTIIGTQCIFWDVTARFRAEQAVAESERRYRQLTEATLDAIIVADQNGLITLFNPAAERLFGYQADEVVGQSLTLLIPEEFQQAHSLGFQRYLETRQPRLIGRNVELQGQRKDGKVFPLEISLSVFSLEGPLDAEGRPPLQFLGALRDLTERNHMHSVLIQTEKMRSIGLVSAGVAHEINNPLAFVANNLAVLDRETKGLMSLVDLLQEQQPALSLAVPELAEQVQVLAEKIDLTYLRDNLGRLISKTREGVDRVTRIVNSLRSLSRPDTLRRQETSLPALVESNLDILQGRLKRAGITVEQDHDPWPRVVCATGQIGQVLLNLIVNAIQALESAGREGGRIRIRTQKLDTEMLIEVSDNGPGIDAEHLPRLFDPFFTTKEAGEGTGLGLSICHNIVAAHEGRIEVASPPGAGACFRVFLPLQPQGEKP